MHTCKRCQLRDDRRMFKCCFLPICSLRGPFSRLGYHAGMLQLAIVTQFMAGLTYATGLGLPLLPACPSIMLPCGLRAGPPCKALPEVAPEEVLIVCAP